MLKLVIYSITPCIIILIQVVQPYDIFDEKKNMLSNISHFFFLNKMQTLLFYFVPIPEQNVYFYDEQISFLRFLSIDK